MKKRMFFWYEILLLFIIAIFVFWGGDIRRLVLKSGLAGTDIKEKATVEAGRDAETGKGQSDGAVEAGDTQTNGTAQKETKRGDKEAEEASEAGQLNSPENDAARQIFVMDGTLLVRMGGELVGYDVEGNRLSERRLGGKSTRIVEYGDKYILYEADLGIIALVGSDNQLIKELRLDTELESIKVSKERIFVKPRNKNSILFLDSELNEDGRVEIKNRELIFIEANFDRSELLCYNTEIAENKLSSSLIVYNKHQKVIASLDLNTSLLLDMHSASSIFLISDGAIMNYSTDLQPLYEKPYEGEISLSQTDKNRLYFVMDRSMRAGGKEFVVYGSEGEEAYFSLKSNVEHVRLGKKYILLASKDKIALLNYEFKVLQEKNFVEDIEEVDWIDEEHFYLKSRDRLKIYSIN